MNTEQITKIVDSVKIGDHEYYGDSIVGLNEYGYWVSSNGEEVEGLTRQGAIQIVYENENS